MLLNLPMGLIVVCLEQFLCTVETLASEGPGLLLRLAIHCAALLVVAWEFAFKVAPQLMLVCWLWELLPLMHASGFVLLSGWLKTHLVPVPQMQSSLVVLNTVVSGFSSPRVHALRFSGWPMNPGLLSLNSPFQLTIFFSCYRCLLARWLGNRLYLGIRDVFSLGEGKVTACFQTFKIWGPSCNLAVQC